MPFARRRPRRVGRKLRRRLARAPGYRRVIRKAMYNSQVFSETIKATNNSFGVDVSGVIQIAGGSQGTAGKFLFQMQQLPQFTSYQALQNMYKVLSITAIIMPKWIGADPNTAGQNNSIGQVSYENPRFVQAINDNPNDTAPPTSELDVLQDNGCKIRKLTQPIKITFRPRPVLDTTSPQNNALIPTMLPQKPWIGFDSQGGNVNHVGVDWYASCDNVSTQSTFLDVADVQYKVRFICKDPR